MAEVYPTARQFLDDVVNFVVKLVERQIVAHWEYGLLPAPPDRSVNVAIGEVASVHIGNPRQMSPRGVAEIARLDEDIAAHYNAIYDRLEASCDASVSPPLDEVRQRFRLSSTEERALWVVIAAEISPRVRQLMRYLANDPTRVVPDIGMLDTLIYAAARDSYVAELGSKARLFRFQLLEELGGRGRESFVGRGIRAAPRVLDLAAGELALDASLEQYATLISGLGSELLVPDDVLATTCQLVKDGQLEGRASPLVVLCGRLGGGRKALLAAAARAIGKSLLRIRCADLPTEHESLTQVLRSLLREATLLDALPVLDELEELLPPDDPDKQRVRRVDNAIADWDGAIAATATSDDVGRLRLSRRIVRLDIPPMSETQRATMWKRELDATGMSKLDPDVLAARYPVTGGTIISAAGSARSLAAARNGVITDADVHAGLRTAMEERISALGTRVTWSQKWDELVLPPDIMDALREFISRVRHRRLVYDQWGFAEKLAKGLGLSALFSGPPGTGKSMVAGVIGSQLGLDVYQIEVSRIVSKYIGETEKNLARVFDAAEAGASILLFDEADSLFAQRGEVKSSVDRYANLEVNYLLQRMERFSGITILTTNLAASIDEAFKRRISFTIDFPMPEAEERALLWKKHLPRAAEFAQDIDYRGLAERFEMSGGHIRNAVLRAAFLAADEGVKIANKHMRRAAELEYQAMGKVI